MEQKTKINVEDGKQDLMITREFDLSLELLFKAHTDPDIVEQWMGTNVLKLASKRHGSWQFETTDVQGNVVFRANGVIHEFIPNRNTGSLRLSPLFLVHHWYLESTGRDNYSTATI